MAACCAGPVVVVVVRTGGPASWLLAPPVPVHVTASRYHANTILGAALPAWGEGGRRCRSARSFQPDLLRHVSPSQDAPAAAAATLIRVTRRPGLCGFSHPTEEAMPRQRCAGVEARTGGHSVTPARSLRPRGSPNVFLQDNKKSTPSPVRAFPSPRSAPRGTRRQNTPTRAQSVLAKSSVRQPASPSVSQSCSSRQGQAE